MAGGASGVNCGRADELHRALSRSRPSRPWRDPLDPETFAARLIPSAGAMASDDTGAIINFGTGSGASGLIAQWGITLPIGAVITGYTAYLRKISDATCTAQMQLEIWNYTGGGRRYQLRRLCPRRGPAPKQNANDGSGTPIVTTLTLSGITKTVTAGDQYHLSWRSGAAQLGDQMYQVEINYTEPSV